MAAVQTATDVPGGVEDGGCVEIGVEVAALVRLAHRLDARTVVIGHGRDAASMVDADRFGAAFEASDGIVLARVSWPEEAASWLRQARRLAGPEPDLWVLGGPPTGLARVIVRLAGTSTWTPARTLLLGVADPAGLGVLAGAGTLTGVRGAGPDGRLWQLAGTRVEPFDLPADGRRIR